MLVAALSGRQRCPSGKGCARGAALALLLWWLVLGWHEARAQSRAPGSLSDRWVRAQAQERFGLSEFRLALDYARALQQLGQRARADAVLLRALREVDLDRPLRRERILEQGWDGSEGPGFELRGFLREARRLAGPTLGEELPRSGPALRTLAELRRLEGRPQQALAWDLAYLEEVEWPEEQRQLHRAEAFWQAGRRRAALQTLRRAAQLWPAWEGGTLDPEPWEASLAAQREGREELAWALARQAWEEALAARRTERSESPSGAPPESWLPPLGPHPRGEFLLFCPQLGPIDGGSLIRAIRAHGYEARLLAHDPGFRGYREGQVALELTYLADSVYEAHGALLLGESQAGWARVYGGSVARYVAKNEAGWLGRAERAEVLGRVATYVAKHEVLVHHSGNFLRRRFRRDYRGNIRGDAYALDGFLESNHPNDILWNLPELVSPRHPWRSPGAGQPLGQPKI